MKRISILMIAVLMSLAMFAQQPQPAQQTPAEKEAAYTKTLTDRAQKIVDKLGLKDAAQGVRVRDILVEQYRNLSKIHDGRDVQVKALKADKSLAKEVVDAKVNFLVADADAQLYTLHGEFLGKLYSELTPDQIVMVKDAMTYNKVNVTMTAYKEMMLKLTDEQIKKAIQPVMYWEPKVRYVRDIAEPIDAEGQRNGAFLSVTTFMTRDTTSTWTHMRVFVLRDSTQLREMSGKLDAAGVKLEPDSVKRRLRGEYSASLRESAGRATVAILR